MSSKPTEQIIFAITRPDGSISLRTLHPRPSVALQRAEEDHTSDWIDLQAQGYRLATIVLIVETVHDNAYAAVQRHVLQQKSTATSKL